MSMMSTLFTVTLLAWTIAFCHPTYEQPKEILRGPFSRSPGLTSSPCTAASPLQLQSTGEPCLVWFGFFHSTTVVCFSVLVDLGRVIVRLLKIQ